MSSVVPVLHAVVPAFALIAIGFGLQRTGTVSEGLGRALSEFVFKVAAPALLFRTMQTMDLGAAQPIGLWTAYFGATAATWLVATAVARLVLKRAPADCAAIAMASCFGNILMLGLPMGLAYFGEAGTTPMALIISLSAPLLWTFGTFHIEWALQAPGRSWSRRFGELLASLARNPIVVAVLAGLVWRLVGLGVPATVERVLALLAQAAAPAALVALGCGLTAFQPRGETPTLIALIVLKLVVAPALTAVLAFGLMELPHDWASVAVFLAACPAGANAFVFATRYERALGSVAGAVAVGTALSALTIPALLLLLAP